MQTDLPSLVRIRVIALTGQYFKFMCEERCLSPLTLAGRDTGLHRNPTIRAGVNNNFRPQAAFSPFDLDMFPVHTLEIETQNFALPAVISDKKKAVY